MKVKDKFINYKKNKVTEQLQKVENVLRRIEFPSNIEFRMLIL